MEIKSKNTIKDINKLKRQIISAIKDITYDPDRLKSFSKFMMNFHNYSIFNRALIFAQNENAVQVAGYNTWKNKFNRQVKQGETGIKILAPILIKDKTSSDDTQIKTLVGFKGVTVFDIKQTEGDDIQIPSPSGLVVNNPEDLYKEMVFMASLDKYTIKEDTIQCDTDYDITDNTITINKHIKLDSKILALIKAVSAKSLGYYVVKESTEEMEIDLSSTLLGSVIGVPINLNIYIEKLNDKSISKCFKVLEELSSTFGITLDN